MKRILSISMGLLLSVATSVQPAFFDDIKDFVGQALPQVNLFQDQIGNVNQQINQADQHIQQLHNQHQQTQRAFDRINLKIGAATIVAVTAFTLSAVCYYYSVKK